MATREPALNLIIAYKTVRGGAALLAGLSFLALIAGHVDDSVRSFAVRLREESVSGLTEGLTALLGWAIEPNHILVVGTLLTLDGIITVLEGYALLRGWRWGVWLVVAATSMLLPFEIAALIDEVTAFRSVVLIINLVIVAWLLRQRWAQIQGPTKLPENRTPVTQM